MAGPIAAESSSLERYAFARLASKLFLRGITPNETRGRGCRTAPAAFPRGGRHATATWGSTCTGMLK